MDFWTEGGRPPTPGDLRRFVDMAPRGSALQYHEGLLATDRVIVLTEGGRLVYIPVEVVDDVAKAAWQAYRAGEVMLVQRRRGPRVFEYFAIRR